MDFFDCCGTRKPVNESGAHGPRPLAGVGIVFQPDDNGQLFVKSLAVGGPADLSGKVNVGDCLREVNEEVVVGQSINNVAHMILGQPGTSVRLTLLRGNQPIRVDLIRGWALNSRAATPNRWSHPLPADSRLVTANISDSH